MSTSKPSREIQRKPSAKSVWIVEMYDMLGGKWTPYSLFCNGEFGIFENRKIAREYKKSYETRYPTVYFRVTRYWSERAIEIIHVGKDSSFYDFDETTED